MSRGGGEGPWGQCQGRDDKEEGAPWGGGYPPAWAVPPAPIPSPCLPQADSRLCNGSDKDCVFPTARVTKKETLKVGPGQGNGGRRVAGAGEMGLGWGCLA